jgi:hypothetical protein
VVASREKWLHDDEMAKYDPLRDHLDQRPEPIIVMTFAE